MIMLYFYSVPPPHHIIRKLQREIAYNDVKK